MQKLLLILITATAVLFAFDQQVFSQSFNNLKITDNLGLTRAFKNNVKSTHKVLISIKNSAAGNVLGMLNSENGQTLSPDQTRKVQENTHFVFHNVTSGNWIIESQNSDLKIEEVRILGD